MKRVIALFLTVALLMSVCPVHILASEDEFVGISIVLNGIEKQCRVIESGDELLFSGEDLAVFGGYTYRVDGDNAFFTRGQKTVRVNMARNILIPFDGTAYSESNKNITLNTSVREKDGVYYFPGTQLLPWLSVNCSVKNGKLHIITDEVSIWDLVGEFNPEDYAFDFAECCEALGKDSKWVKAGAAFHGFGLETVFGWLPPFGNDSNDEHDYYDIFEEMLQDQTCSQTFVDDMMEDVGKINEWMDWAETMKVKDELPDDWKAVGMVSDFVGSAPVELSVELGMYLSTMEMDNSEKLNAIKHIVLSGGDFPDEMRAAAETIYLEYTDYILGILGKGIDVLYEALKDLTGEASYEAVKKMAGELAGDVYEIALAVLDFPEMIEYDCTEGIRRVDCYSAIASESIKEYQEYKSVISDIGIQNTRSTAYLYLYAVEQNWRTMSDYALEKGFLEYAAEYRANADAAQEIASLFLNSAFSQINDSPEYAAGELRRKQGYTDILKDMFSVLTRMANKEKRLSAIHEYSDDEGTIYSFQYDDLGRIKEIDEYYYGEYNTGDGDDSIYIVNTYEYDELNRLTLANDYNGYDITNYYYNSRGFLERTTSSYMDYVDTSYTYDDFNRLILEEVKYNDVPMYIEYKYNDRDELIQVSVEGGYGNYSEVFAPGIDNTDNSTAFLYYNLMIAHIDTQYPPFAINNVISSASINDAAGNAIFSLSLSDPQFITDEFGYLSKIVSEYYTYELYYVDATVNEVNSVSPNLSKELSMLEYAILIGALRDAGLAEIRWELSDADADGTHELIMQASGDDWYNYPLLADIDERLLWYYTPSGPASSSEWSFLSALNKCAFVDMYGSAAYSGSKYFTWSGKNWDLFAGYERSITEYDAEGNPVFSERCEWLGSEISTDQYAERISDLAVTDLTLASTPLSEISIVGDPTQITNEIEAYISESGRFFLKNEVNANKIVYMIPSAANIWKTEPSDIAEEFGKSNFDCALTFITAYVSEESVSLALTRTYSYEG